MEEYRTIQQDGQIEIDIKKSRFICHLKRVTSEEEARSFIQQIKKEHYKATHNCSCFILGEKSEIKRSSDDGEPSGTAGIPMLTVLEKQELTNVVAVVTRYFGGIKLGAGGLIRAYGGAVAEGVRELGSVLVKEQVGLEIELSYAQYQEFHNWLQKHNLMEHEPQFLEQVTTTIYTDEERVEALLADLTDCYHGKVTTQEKGNRIVEILLTD